MNSRCSTWPGYSVGASQGRLPRGHRHVGARANMPGVGEAHSAGVRGGSVVSPVRGMALALSGARGSGKNGCGAEEPVDDGTDLVQEKGGRDRREERGKRRREFIVPNDVERRAGYTTRTKRVSPNDT